VDSNAGTTQTAGGTEGQYHWNCIACNGFLAKCEGKSRDSPANLSIVRENI